MAMTHDPADKFAFLFSGRTDAKSLHNLKEIYDLLTKYCNYPALNVQMYIGGTDSASILTTGTYTVVSDVTDFRNKFFDFATLVNNRNTVTDGISNPVNTVLLYFTGSANPADTANFYAVIEGPPLLSISQSNFKFTLKGFNSALDDRKNYLLNSYVHIVFDLDSAGDLDNNFITTLDSTLTGSKTYSCSSGETSEIDTSGASKFTYFWCRAFKMVPFTQGATTYYGDTMITVPPESINEELVSVLKACEFAKLQWTGAPPSQNPACTYIIDSGPLYLGLPWPVIRDGNPNMWESPDIILSHPGIADHEYEYYTDDSAHYTDAGYIFKNDINVTIWNFGTHPIIHLKLDIILYDTGCSGTGYIPTMIEEILRTSNKYLTPAIDSASPAIATWADTEDPSLTFITGKQYVFDSVPFLLDSHRCIRAKTVWGPSALPAMNDWDYAARDQEAQANIDLGSVSGKKANIDISGIFRKHFILANPIKKRKTFRIVYPPISELKDLIEVKIFRSGQRLFEMKKSKFGIQDFFDVTLDAGTRADFIMEVRNKVNLTAFEKIELPVEIMVAEKSVTAEMLKRNNARMPGFVTIAGFTIMLMISDANMTVRITDEKGRPAAFSKVLIETADNLHRAELKTDKDGLIRLEGINPAKYNIKVMGKSGKISKPVFADLTLSRERIMRLQFRKSLLG